jgi:hypothetical protein
MLKHNGPSLEISGNSINVGELKGAIDKKLLDAVTQILVLLDNYQYQLCMLIKEAGDDRDTKFNLSKIRMAATTQITRFMTLLIASVSEPNNVQLQNTVKETLLSIVANTESLFEDIQGSNFLNVQHKDLTTEKITENILNSNMSMNQSLKPLKELYPEMDKKKDYIPGNVKVQLTPQSMKAFNQVGSRISNEIRNIPGVVDVWFSDSKSFHLLVNIEVYDYNEGQNIESKIKGIDGINSAKVYLATRSVDNAK